jgi:hypothetical protein
MNYYSDRRQMFFFCFLSDFINKTSFRQTHNVLGHTNFWKKQQTNLQFFFGRCKLGCLIKIKTKGFKNIFIGSLFNSIMNERV